MNQKVLCIIPAYNADKTISNAIQSILQQTYKNIDILCIAHNSDWLEYLPHERTISREGKK